MLWIGPDEWLVVTPDRRAARIERVLRDALDGQHAALIDVSHSRTILTLSGPDARAVLSNGCPLDFHPRVFVPDAAPVEARQVSGSDPPHERDTRVRDLRAPQLRAVHLDMARGRGREFGVRIVVGGVGNSGLYRRVAPHTLPYVLPLPVGISGHTYAEFGHPSPSPIDARCGAGSAVAGGRAERL